MSYGASAAGERAPTVTANYSAMSVLMIYGWVWAITCVSGRFGQWYRPRRHTMRLA